MENQASQCAHLIREAKSIAVLTGAGISTKAGIPDFRGPQGLYITKRYDPEIVFDINYFYKDPKPFFAFARDFIHLETTIKPTFAHQFFAKLERSGKLTGVITQNIDALHQRAGNQKVLEMHGSFFESRCLDCDKQFSWDDLKQEIFKDDVPRCSCRGVIKPDIVFFGENVRHLFDAQKLAEEAELFFVVGTSCVVFPAAILPQFAKGKVVVVNLSPVELPIFNVALSVEEDIDEFLQSVDQLL